MQSSGSVQPGSNLPQINPAETDVQKPIDKVSQDLRIQTVVSGISTESSTPNDLKTLDCDITLSDEQLDLSEDVTEACDLFFHVDKKIEKEKIDAAVSTVFKAVVEQAEKEKIQEGVENISVENPEHHFIIGAHEFHFSLVRDIQNEHQIEIYQKIGELGQGTFGKVSEFKNLDTGKVYASKQASPKDGLPLHEAEHQYQEAQNELTSAKHTGDEEAIQKAQAQLDNNIYYLEIAKAAEKDIKKEIKNLKLYNPDLHKPALGIQPRYHKVSSNYGTRYMIEKGSDGYQLMDKMNELSGADKIHFNRKITDTLTSGLDYIVGKGMCHADIKPQNMLYKGESLKSGDFQIYHADFGGDQSLKKIVSKLSDPLDTTPINELMISSAAYTSLKAIQKILELRKIIHSKIEQGVDIKEDQAKLKTLIVDSCKFSLGLSLIHMCSGDYPEIDAKENSGLFGQKNHEGDLQVAIDDFYTYFEADEETEKIVMELLGMGKDFNLVDGQVIMIEIK